MQQGGNRKESGRKEKNASSIIIKRRHAENEASGQVKNQAENHQTPIEATEDDPNETLRPNPFPESEPATDVEEGDVTKATKSESETIAYEQSEEEE